MVAPPDRMVLADREHRFAPPAWRMFDALTVERETWLRLREREVPPTIVEEDRPHYVVWSSLWPVSLNDTIDFALRPNGDGSLIRWRWTTDQPPDERGINIVRYRLNYILADRLRFWVDTQIS